MRQKFDDMGARRGDAAVTRIADLVATRLAKSWEGVVVRGFESVTRMKRASQRARFCTILWTLPVVCTSGIDTHGNLVADRPYAFRS